MLPGVFQLEVQIVPPPQQLNPAPIMAEPIPHVAEDFDWLSYLANHPAAQTIFESKVVVEDKNTKAPAAAAKAGGCVLGATEPKCMQPSRISNSRASCLA